MDIQLNHSSSTPLYIQLKLTIRDKILSGELPERFRLPSERQLAGRLSVHRNTVVKAYEALIAEGLVVSSRQRPCGYFVANGSGEPAADESGYSSFSSTDKAFKYHFINAQNRFEELYHSSYDTAGISFAAILTNRDALPLAYLKELMQEIIDGDSLEPFWFCDPQGMECLRSNLAETLFARNIYVRPRNIQIVGETYEAINNIAYMYLEKGDYVIVEEPVVPAIADIFLHVGANLLFVPMEQDGIRMDILEAFVQRYKPKLIYTMPNYQNPTSCTMSIEKRKRLLACARSGSIPIIEDDSMFEYYYNDTRLPSLYFMDQSNSVIYLDTAGLSFYPGARLGYIVAPDHVIKTYQHIVNKDSLFMNSMGQYLWAEFFKKRFYEKHALFLKEFYRKKRDLMCRCLEDIPELSFTVPEGGLCVWARIEEDLNDVQIALLCEKMGLLIMPGSIFYPEGSKGGNYLRLSFSSATDEQMVSGVQLLKKAVDACKLKNSQDRSPQNPFLKVVHIKK